MFKSIESLLDVTRNGHRYGLAALGAWACVLALTDGMSAGSLLVLLAHAAFVFGVTMALRPCAWRPALLLFGFSTLWFGFAILLVQQFPQATGINPDAILYDLQARALDLHWQGRTVPTESFGVLPFENPDGTRIFEYWRPLDRWGLAFVMGSSHFAYQLYVAVFYVLSDMPLQGVLLSHAALLGSLPLLAFGVASRFFSRSARVPLLAAVLVVLDLNFSVSAAWLLKDTLVTWVTALAATAAVDLVNRRLGSLAAAVLVAALIVLAISRAHVFYALVLVIVAWSLMQWIRTGKHTALPIVVVAVAWLGAGASLISDFAKPASGLAAEAATAPLSALRGFQHVAGASFQAAPVPPTVVADGVVVSPGDRCAVEGAVDGVVCDFHASLREAPLWTITRSVARTLFAPYPWVALHPGLTWESFTELYYPGTLLWIALLPFFCLGVLFAPRGRGSGLVLAFAAIICLTYIGVLGEFSTRQRQFLMPLLVPFSAWGVVEARHLWQRTWRAWNPARLEEQSS